MRQPASAELIGRFLRELGRRSRLPAHVYLVGGATAVLSGWRATTVDIDLVFEPETDELYRGVRDLKDELGVNVELAAPSHFIPELPGWRDRSPFVVTEGSLSVHHYDLHAQALAKIERGHAKDLEDVSEMLRRGLVTADRLRELFEAARPQLVRYPAIDEASFARAVAEALAPFEKKEP
jgi:hypothetical protein